VDSYFLGAQLPVSKNEAAMVETESQLNLMMSQINRAASASTNQSYIAFFLP